MLATASGGIHVAAEDVHRIRLLAPDCRVPRQPLHRASLSGGGGGRNEELIPDSEWGLGRRGGGPPPPSKTQKKKIHLPEAVMLWLCVFAPS